MFSDYALELAVRKRVACESACGTRSHALPQWAPSPPRPASANPGDSVAAEVTRRSFVLLDQCIEANQLRTNRLGAELQLSRLLSQVRGAPRSASAFPSKQLLIPPWWWYL